MLVWIRDTYGGSGEAESGVEVRVFVEFGVLLVDSAGCVRWVWVWSGGGGKNSLSVEGEIIDM